MNNNKNNDQKKILEKNHFGSWQKKRPYTNRQVIVIIRSHLLENHLLFINPTTENGFLAPTCCLYYCHRHHHHQLTDKCKAMNRGFLKKKKFRMQIFSYCLFARVCVCVCCDMNMDRSERLSLRAPVSEFYHHHHYQQIKCFSIWGGSGEGN